ncbi:MAG: signal peptidase I [Acidobacteriota bacterium]
MKKMEKKGKYKFYILNILAAAFISILLFTFLFTPYKISGNSMFPSLKNGQRVIISKIFSINDLKRFDIVVLKVSGNRTNIVKRIIALPGELFEIKKGDIYINNMKIKTPFLKNFGDVMFRSVNFGQLKIPERFYFTLGDNRDQSIDSRSFGPVNMEQIKGKAALIYWPLSSFGGIK